MANIRSFYTNNNKCNICMDSTLVLTEIWFINTDNPSIYL